ncbi:MAG TPA: hypothetical protein VFW46_02435 [Stellaceae bacterium]|nr:hypothetical protein [Stellaceae bacterium]
MNNKIAAVAVAAIAAGAFASAAMADSTYSPATAGPKVSGGNYIAPSAPMPAPATVAAVQAAPGGGHWVYQQGYDPHGKWHWHWVQVP